MGLFIGKKPLTDASGAHIFRYGRGMNYLSVLCAAALSIATVLEPPTKLGDIVIAVLLIASALYMSIHTEKYQLVLRNNIIYRDSPWPWHKQSVFNINETSMIEIKYRELYVSLKMKNGAELRVPILLIGAYQLLRTVMDNSDSEASSNVKAAIEHFS